MKISKDTFTQCCKHTKNTDLYIYRQTSVETYAGLEQKNSMQKQSTVECKNRHADMLDAHTTYTCTHCNWTKWTCKDTPNFHSRETNWIYV